MPFTIDPLAPGFTTPTTATSPDGFLKATLDAKWAGVLLHCDLHTVTPTKPYKIFFLRAEDGSAVRGGDAAFSPGGYAWAYDHEVPLGAATAWVAVGVDRFGVAVFETDAVSLAMPAPITGENGPSTWIKSIEDPSLSLNLMIVEWGDITYDVFSQVTHVPGRRKNVGVWDTLGGVNGTAQLLTTNPDDAAAVVDLVNSGTLLFQTSPIFDRPSAYVMPSGLARSDLGRMKDHYTAWSFGIEEIDRPDTTNQPGRMPGSSFADRLAAYATFNDIPAGFKFQDQIAVS